MFSRASLSGLYTIFWTLLTGLLLMVAWLTCSTQFLMGVEDIHYDGDQVTFVRTTPFGDVWAEWTTEIRVSRESKECHSGRHRALYQQIPEGNAEGATPHTVNYSLGPWATPCLNFGPPLIIVNSWQAYLFGVIPLRPHHLTTIVDAQGVSRVRGSR